MADEQVEDIVKCPECNSRNLDRDETRGEIVCQDCGLVLEDNVIDQGAEWRVFSPEQGDQRARTGAPMTVMLHDKGLSTIRLADKDYSGKTINSRYRSQFYRMRSGRSEAVSAMPPGKTLPWHWQDWIEWPADLGCKTVRESAAVNYKKAVEKRLIRGRSIEVLLQPACTPPVASVEFLEHLTKSVKQAERPERNRPNLSIHGS